MAYIRDDNHLTKNINRLNPKKKFAEAYKENKAYMDNNK
jgi:hypothetical protein